MQKIAIIGPGSTDLVAELNELHPGYVFIGLADADAIQVAQPEPLDYRAMPTSFSCDFEYNPSDREREWLLEQIRLGERVEIMNFKPAPLLDEGALCSASYWYSSAKENAWRAQRPRHRSEFTKSRPTAKARKAARKRAKAGRKASR